MEAKRTPGIGFIVVGAVLFFCAGPVAIVTWYAFDRAPLPVTVALDALIPIGLALIIVGATLNSRSRRQPVPPPITR